MYEFTSPRLQMELLPSNVAKQQQAEDDLREAVGDHRSSANTHGRTSLHIGEVSADV